MTQNNKPEWFEITDADEKPALRKVSKSLPFSAVLAVTLILGIGAVVGPAQNESPASALSATSMQAPSSESNPTTVAVVAGSVVTSKLANPSISKLPTENETENEDGDYEDDHENDDEDEEEEDN
jgi:hypothetical protein